MSHRNPIYAHLVSHAADQEPAHSSWDWSDLPELSAEDQRLICSVEPQRVADHFDPIDFVGDVIAGRNPAVRVPQMLENACRKVLFYDVEQECEARYEENQRERDLRRRESSEAMHGVARLFR